MSPRAACRLTQLGATEVYDYVGGKTDWLAHGLTYEGEAELVGRHLHDVPTCTPDERIGAVAARPQIDSLCVVVGPGRVVLGTLDRHALTVDGDAVVAAVGRYGPTTVRPSEERSALEDRMEAKDVDHILVTDPAGRLLGAFRR